jgi:hypothetical protein
MPVPALISVEGCLSHNSWVIAGAISENSPTFVLPVISDPKIERQRSYAEYLRLMFRVAFILIARQGFIRAKYGNHVFCRQIISHASSKRSKTLDRVIWLSELVISVAL